MAEPTHELAVESLAAALDQFRNLISPELLDALQPSGPAMVYTPWVTVWLLVYQRLHQNASLQSAVAELLKIVGAFSTNKRVRQGTLSSNTGAYSQARSRLKITVTDAVADHVFAAIVAATPPSFGDRRVFVLDGTTLSLQSHDRFASVGRRGRISMGRGRGRSAIWCWLTSWPAERRCVRKWERCTVRRPIRKWRWPCV
jgi:hypothetical protein